MKKKRVIIDGQDVYVNFNYPISVECELKHDAIDPSDLTYKEHHHNFTELVLICSGQGTHMLEGSSFPVSAGDVFVVQGKQKHCYQGGGFTLMNIMYEPEELELPEERLCNIPGYRALFLLEPRHRDLHSFSSRLHLGPAALGHAERLGIAIQSEGNEKQPGYDVGAIALMIELMVFLSRAYEQVETPEASALLSMGELLGMLEKDYERDWTIEQMQDIVHMSRSSFSRTFRRATGQSPMEYLIRMRLQQSVRLLVESEMRVTEVAFSSGFNDGNYFTRQFRKVYKCSPRDYRKQYRAEG